MIKCGFYIENDGLKSVDWIGGQYCLVQIH